MARRRLFVPEVRQGRAVADGDQAHHLSRVLRVEPGQIFELSDRRRLYLARVAESRTSRVVFEIQQELDPGPSLPEVTLYAAVFKFDRFEWMLEKATELGVARVVPVQAARTERHLAYAATRRVERWRRIVREAAEQSRRLAPPEVTDPRPLEQALLEPAAGARWILDEACSGPSPAPVDSSGACLLAGPEGGWTDQERELAGGGGFRPVCLGPLILRSETAAIAALAVLLHTRLK